MANASDKYYKSTDQVLTVSHSFHPTGYDKRYYTYIFDFEFKTLTVSTSVENSSGRAGVTVMPFSQVDPDTLEKMREKLVELGGKPDPLPGVSVVSKLPAPKPAAKGLNP